MSGFERPVNYAGYIRAISLQTKKRKKASEFEKVTILCGIIRESHCSFSKAMITYTYGSNRKYCTVAARFPGSSSSDSSRHVQKMLLFFLSYVHFKQTLTRLSDIIIIMMMMMRHTFSIPLFPAERPQRAHGPMCSVCSITIGRTNTDSHLSILSLCRGIITHSCFVYL